MSFEPIYRKDRAVSLPNPTAAYQIFFNTYRCRGPRIHLVSAVHFEQIGVGGTGDKGLDNQLFKEELSMYINIARMVELHYDGIAFIIENPNDSVEIYKLIKQHLTDWDLELHHTVNRKEPPIDALIAMDEFASTLWGVAKYQVKEEIHTNSLMQVMARLGRSTPLLRNRLENIKPTENQFTNREHDPFRDAFIRHESNFKDR